jgi:subtilisin family serine protease
MRRKYACFTRPARLVAASAVAGLLCAIGLPAQAQIFSDRVAPSVTPPTVNVTVRPDLVVETIALDSNCRVVLTVANRGPGTVPSSVWTTKTPASSSVYLHVNGNPWGGQTIWSFDPSRKLQNAGGSTTVTLNYTVSSTATLRATIDHTAQVAEVDEGNNALTATLACGAGASALPTVVLPERPPISPRITLDGSKAAAPEAPIPEATVSSPTPEPAPPSDASPSSPTMPVPSSGGSLLQIGLPPPPANLPPPSPRDDATVEPAEVVVASSDMPQAVALAQVAQRLGFAVRRRSNLQGLGLVLTVLRVPNGMTVGAALALLRQAEPSVWADANHRYALQGDEARAYGRKLIGATTVSPQCGKGVRIGLLDAGVDQSHPALIGRDIASRSFLAAGIPAAKPEHGTAIAAILVGRDSGDNMGGLAPGATLLSAEVFRVRANVAETTAEWIVLGLDWLLTQKADIVNISIGGPRNLLLEAAITRAIQRGIVIVAAAGNDGPDASPVYPAAQAGVVAVTAVDAELKPYRKANRADYVMFSAPGVDVWSATPGGGGKYYSGTSYAAPFVTAVFAHLRQIQPKAQGTPLVQRAQSLVRDLGAPGKDPVYGWGLIQAPGCGEAKSR